MKSLPLSKEGTILQKYALEISQRVPKKFLPSYRSPCWQETDGLKCLPYFYQIGSYKSGTSDIWDKLVQHPDVVPVLKEPHWWAWRRFGYKELPCHHEMVLKIRDLTGKGDDSSLDWYLNWFRHQTGNMSPNQVIGDGSITALWGIADGIANYTDPEPSHVLADVIHAVQPGAKVYAILRNPLDRALSEYFYSHKRETKTPEEFHEEVVKSLKETKDCLRTKKSARACAFSLKIGNWTKFVPLHGAYYLYLKEWVEAYGRDNVHVIKTEDWIDEPKEVLTNLISFLKLDPLPETKLASILMRKVRNSRKQRKSQFKIMLNSTRHLLEEFYRPWNRELVKLLGHSSFSWGI
ncbi:carbohydrate sulfotransferase 15-like [Apostichopus japonicus]|uniref:carbohydrate sulfotransferase 15-like n=1 Tax=Stichopus japonicus TaxID=307972 RepID=UPI003AB8470E